MMDDQRAVSPVEPPASYVGGKSKLAARLITLIESARHTTYAEPFVGMGGVFLRRRSAARAEVINDLSGDVATLFRILQRHYVPFMDLLRYQLTSRRDFERLLAVDPATLTDLERAARFLYLQRLAFGGKVMHRCFGVSPGMPGRFDVTKLGPALADIAERLAGVIIENLGYRDFIQRYDSPETLFFVDPPYIGSEHYYGREAFAVGEHRALAAQLAGIAGSFILTINDCPLAREIFAGFDIETEPVTYTVNGSVPTFTSELIVTRIRSRRPVGLFG